MRHHLVTALALAGLSWACGGGTPQSADGPLPPSPTPSPTPAPARATFAYAAYSLGEDGVIAAYRVDVATGALATVASTHVAGGPKGLAADAGGRYVYTVSNLDDFPANPVVVSYRIEPAGALTEIGRLAAPARWSKGGRVLAATGHFVYVLLDDSSTAYSAAIMVYGIGADGTLTQVGYSGAGLSCCLQFFSVDASGHSVFMDSGGSQTVMGFSANADGTLAGAGSAPTLGVPTAGALHASARWLLVGGYGPSNEPYLASYAAGAGTLQGPAASVTLAFVPQQVVADPQGRFAYASNYERLAGYRFDGQTGGLVAADLQRVAVDVMAIEPGGRYLYAGGGSGVIPFAIDPTNGSLRDLNAAARPEPGARLLTGLAVVAVP